MKALTLTQPWASLMALRQKTIETRSWYTKYRGDLVIHAAKAFPKWAVEICEDPVFSSALRVPAASLPLGIGLCVVRVVDCIHTEEMPMAEALLGRKLATAEYEFGDYSDGRYAWLTEYVRPLTPVGPVRGSIGLWDWAESDSAREELAARKKVMP